MYTILKYRYIKSCKVLKLNRFEIDKNKKNNSIKTNCGTLILLHLYQLRYSINLHQQHQAQLRKKRGFVKQFGDLLTFSYLRANRCF